MVTTSGADRHANSAPRPAASTASIAFSTRSICTKRPRPAPMATRSAISRDRIADCAIFRLATLAQAISRTIATRTPRMLKALRYSS